MPPWAAKSLPLENLRSGTFLSILVCPLSCSSLYYLWNREPDLYLSVFHISCWSIFEVQVTDSLWAFLTAHLWMRESVFVSILTPDTVCAKDRLKLIRREDIIVACQMCFIDDCACPFCIGAVTFFQNITSFALDVTMMIAFCIFFIKRNNRLVNTGMKRGHILH